MSGASGKLGYSDMRGIKPQVQEEASGVNKLKGFLVRNWQTAAGMVANSTGTAILFGSLFHGNTAGVLSGAALAVSGAIAMRKVSFFTLADVILVGGLAGAGFSCGFSSLGSTLVESFKERAEHINGAPIITPQTMVPAQSLCNKQNSNGVPFIVSTGGKEQVLTCG